MPTIEERQALRRAFLIALYEEVGDNRLDDRPFATVTERAGIPADQADSVVDWNVDEGLAEFPGGGVIAITSAGIREAERLLQEQQQQATSDVLSVAERRDVEVVLRLLQQAEENGELEPLESEDHAQVQAEIQTIEAQSRAPRPSRRIIHAALVGISQLVIGIAATDLAGPLNHLVAKLAG